jgi:hypothetical protein
MHCGGLCRENLRDLSKRAFRFLPRLPPRILFGQRHATLESEGLAIYLETIGTFAWRLFSARSNIFGLRLAPLRSTEASEHSSAFPAPASVLRPAACVARRCPPLPESFSVPWQPSTLLVCQRNVRNEESLALLSLRKGNRTAGIRHLCALYATAPVNLLQLPRAIYETMQLRHSQSLTSAIVLLTSRR